MGKIHRITRCIFITAILLAGIVLPFPGLAQTGGQEDLQASDPVFSIYDGKGLLITRVYAECDVDDEYISSDNKHYKVIEVKQEEQTAKADYLGIIELPDVSWLNVDSSLPVSAAGGRTRKIALYCTHSDESYREGDGSQSSKQHGGIYDVAQNLADQLKQLGVQVERSNEMHHPHDAGAYRRSRQTAVALLKGTPDAIFDIHRDGIPDPDEYTVTIGNKKMSKVRLLVGRGNQNREANLNFAKQIKAVGDKIYPKLIKDIYMGKGSYNQDLSPRAVLLEFGTHTVNKDRVINSTEPMAEVIYKAMYGGVTGSAGASDVSGTANTREETASNSNKGAGGTIVWIIVALVGGLLLFAFLSGGFKGGMGKFKRSFSEMTGGMVGKKPPKNR
ncbi:MAG: stage II sporulation protein P [Clostridiales bacterium]|nr:stage II sporulation protein P [Clostridiales bacterium]